MNDEQYNKEIQSLFDVDSRQKNMAGALLATLRSTVSFHSNNVNRFFWASLL
jgi:hypothetical protein